MRPSPPGRMALALFGATSMLPGCQEALLPQGHIVLYIDTDAPLPSPAGVVPAESEPPPLFDRVRVELFRDGDSEPCEGCSREFDLDTARVNAGASLVVVANVGTGKAPRVRVRLFRGTPLAADPAPLSTIETVIQLPEIPEEGALEVTAFLATDSVGVPAGSLETPSGATLGWTGLGHAGSWPAAQRVPCADEARAGEVCVPGGAFWMGERTWVDFELEVRPNAQRLVVLAPFWIDDRETTVAEFRSADGVVANTWSGDYEGEFPTNLSDYCTYTEAADPTHDLLPVNCVTPVAAASYCAGRGATLPTEAQFEYVAGGLASRAHPWGADEPRCDDAVWGRLGTVPSDPSLSSACAEPGVVGLPVALIDADGAFRDGRDRVELPTGTVFDLAGNVSEWSRDIANDLDEPCWSREGSQIFWDPECMTAGEQGNLRSFRGGNFIMPAYWTRAAARRAGWDSPETGLRCARPDKAPVAPINCLGFASEYAPECGSCLELNCCAELVEGSGQATLGLNDCAARACEAVCFSSLVIECNAAPPPEEVGACVTLGGAIGCNPVTNEGCSSANGEACDEAAGGFACFGPPNDVELCGACDPGRGPWCAAGSICLFGIGCAKYCCEDADCAPGICQKSDGGAPVFESLPALGVCAQR